MKFMLKLKELTDLIGETLMMQDAERRLVQKILLAFILILSGASLFYGCYYQLSLNGLRGEKQLMLSYLHTLEKTSKLESGDYTFFEDFYGANIGGVDHCKQPEGAARLGFVIRWCHEEQASVVRYAYLVRPILQAGKTGFEAIAHSGSDRQGQSFVCFFSDQEDVWKMTDGKEMIPLKSCE